jgi:nitroreductase
VTAAAKILPVGRAGGARRIDARRRTETMDVDHGRLDMPLGEVLFTQRSIRRFKPDPIPTDELRLLLEAAVRAPSGSNSQPARFLVLTDRSVVRAFGALYREAWWAKRRDEGRPWTTREQIPAEEATARYAARLADEIVDAPCIVLALSTGKGQASSVLPAVQNLMLAARALGIGSVPTTLHPQVMERVRALLGIPDEVDFHLCVPLGRPRGRFGPTRRRPTAETTYLNGWGAPMPWATTAGADRSG